MSTQLGAPNGRSPADRRKSAELLDGIVEIVQREGLAGFSLDRLAAELSTSSRMLVYYFGSKDELLGHIVYALRDATVRELDSDPPATAAIAIDRWWAYYSANLNDMQFFFHLASRRFGDPDSFQEFASTAVDLWAAFFLHGLRNEGRPEAQAAPLARLILAALRGLMVDYLITGQKAEIESALAQLKSFVSQPTTRPAAAQSRRRKKA